MAIAARKPASNGGSFGLGSSTPPEGAAGAALAIALVLGICFLALALGLLLANGLNALADAQNWDEPKRYWLLAFTVVAMVPILFGAVKVFPWLVNWYYLLPAIVCLLAFTVYPIILTFYFAFTNYSAINSGEPDSSAQVEVKIVNPTTLTVLGGAVAATELRCETPDCAGRSVAFLDDRGNTVKKVLNNIVSVNGNTITLTSALPEGLLATRLNRVNDIKVVGFSNFSRIFGQASQQLIPIFVWTVQFAVFTTIINVVVGLVLGILINNRRLKFRNVYRSLLFLPWAVPTVISIQMWTKLLDANFGALNRLFGFIGLNPAPWLIDGLWAKIAILLVNLWLGFPYMMTATVGALSSIPDELYEAAEIDGASRWNQTRFITLPMLTAAFTPIILGTFAFNFNNFGIIYLLTGGKPVEAGQLPTAHSTDILLSWGYNTAFLNGIDRGMASAIAVLVAFLTIAISMVNFSVAGVFKEARK
jgi:arabinogalactan oligomer / maltooligosaccharide transport system permease protein